MQRGEKAGLSIAVVGHLVLFGLLSVGFLATPNPDKLKSTPIEVTLADQVAVESAAPDPSTEAPAEKLAEEEGPVTPDAAPPAPETPPAPEPQPPQPQPAPPEPAPAPKPQPAPPKPAPAPRPAPKPLPKPAPAKPAPPAPKPAPKPAPAAPAKPAPAKPAAAPARPAPAKPAAAPAKPSRTASDAKPVRPTGRLSGILEGLNDSPSPSQSTKSQAARASTQALMNIGSAIKRQVQPCADRQVTPGPGAERIRVTIRLRLNPDGSMAARPAVIGHDGVDDENRRYVERVDDLAIATFTGCAPLRGLPPELYDVQNGWKVFTLRYNLPG